MGDKRLINTNVKRSPIIFNKKGPKCVGGPCPEGKMTCGKIVEIREKFKNL